MFPTSNFLSSTILSGPFVGCWSSNHRSRLYFSPCHLQTTTTSPTTTTCILSSFSDNCSHHHLSPTTTTATAYDLTCCDNLISLIGSFHDQNCTTNTSGTITNGSIKNISNNKDCIEKTTKSINENMINETNNNNNNNSNSNYYYCCWLILSSKMLYYLNYFQKTNILSELIIIFNKIFLQLFKLFIHKNMILIYLIIISYWPSLWAELVFDDRPAIIENKDIRPETPWSRILTNDYWGTSLKSASSHKSYRPLTVITFRLNYMIHQLQPFGYHLLNIFLHIIVTLLFYKLCQRFLSWPQANRINSNGNNNRNSEEHRHYHHHDAGDNSSTPFLVAALFAVHPIHSDCVCSVVGRAELLSGIFYLMSILLWEREKKTDECSSLPQPKPVTYSKKFLLSFKPTFMASRHVSNVVGSSSTSSSWSKLLLWFDKNRRFFSVIMSICGFLCKEQSIFVLLYLVIMNLIGNNYCNKNNNSNNNNINDHYHDNNNYNCDNVSGSSLNNNSSNNKTRMRMVPSFTTIAAINAKNHHNNRWSSTNSISPSWIGSGGHQQRLISNRKLKTIFILLLVFFLVSYLRFILMGSAFPIFNRFDNPASRASFPVKHLTYLYLALYHLWLLLYPMQLSCDWTHSSIELIDLFNVGRFTYDLCRSLLAMLIFCFMAISFYYLSSMLLIRKQHHRHQHQQEQRKRWNFFAIRWLSWWWHFVGYRNSFKASRHSSNISRHAVSLFQVHLARKSLNAISLAIIPFLPVSNLFFPVGFVIAERVLYLPSIGLLLLVGLGIDYLLLFYVSRSSDEKTLPTIRTNDRKDIYSDHKSSKQKYDNSNNIRQQQNLILSWNNKEEQNFYKFPHKKIITLKYLLYFSTIFLTLVFSMKTFLRSFDWANELNLYESGLKINPHNTKLLNNLGRLYENINKSNEAIDLYQKAIKIEPKDPRSYLNLGNIMTKMNHKKSAERWYRKALKVMDMAPISTREKSPSIQLDQVSMSPLYLTALIRLAELLSQDPSKSKDLKQIYHKIMKIQMASFPELQAPSCSEQLKHNTNSNILDQMYNLAVTYYHQGDLKKSLYYFEQILSIDPNHRDSLLTSAQIIQDEDVTQLKQVAFDRLNRLVKLGKNDESIYFNLATLAANNLKFLEARQFYELAISKRESFAEAHYNLALVLMKQMNDFKMDNLIHRNNLKQIIHHLKRVLEINPKHENSMMLLAELYAEEINKLEISQYYYRKILQTINPKNSQAQHNICVLWKKRGNIAKSIDCFKNILDKLIITSNNSQYFKTIQDQINILSMLKFTNVNNNTNNINNFTEMMPEHYHHHPNDKLNKNSCQNLSYESSNLLNHLSTMCFI